MPYPIIAKFRGILNNLCFHFFLDGAFVFVDFFYIININLSYYGFPGSLEASLRKPWGPSHFIAWWQRACARPYNPASCLFSYNRQVTSEPFGRNCTYSSVILHFFQDRLNLVAQGSISLAESNTVFFVCKSFRKNL